MRFSGDWRVRLWGPNGEFFDLSQEEVVGDVRSVKSWVQAADAGFPVPDSASWLAFTEDAGPQDMRDALADSWRRWNPVHMPNWNSNSAVWPAPPTHRIEVDWSAEPQQIADAAMRSLNLTPDLEMGVLYVGPDFRRNELTRLEVSAPGWTIEAFHSAFGPHVQVNVPNLRYAPAVYSVPTVCASPARRTARSHGPGRSTRGHSRSLGIA